MYVHTVPFDLVSASPTSDPDDDCDRIPTCSETIGQNCYNTAIHVSTFTPVIQLHYVVWQADGTH